MVWDVVPGESDVGMRVAFRTDASPQIGSGHVARCVTLGLELAERGAQVSFIARDYATGWYDKIIDASFPLQLLPRPSKPPPVTVDDYGTWLGVAADQDAEETLEAIGAAGCSLLVVDHYGLGIPWERSMREAARQIMAIDDLPERSHDVDVLLNQSSDVVGDGSVVASPRSGVVELLGPRFAVLDPAFRAARGLDVPRSESVHRVLLSFGGSDPQGLTLETLKGLTAPDFDHLEVDVVLGNATAEREEIERIASDHGRVRIWSGLNHLAGLMAASDVAIGAAGATSWERACLGLPSLVVSLANNQEPIGEMLERVGTARYLGRADASSATRLVEAFTELVGDTPALQEMAERGAQLVDGLGALRVAENLDPSDPSEFVIGPRAIRTPQGTTYEAGGRPGQVRYPLLLREQPIGWVGLTEADEHSTVEHWFDPSIIDPNLERHIWVAKERHQRTRLSLRPDRPRSLPIKLASASPPASAPHRVSVVSDEKSWLNSHIPGLLSGWLEAGRLVDWTHDASEVADSDVCFYLSYGQIVGSRHLARHRWNLVVHASELPRGRGWSPMTWAILEGDNTITLTLLEAAEEVDAGRILQQRTIQLQGHELADQWRSIQAAQLNELCRWAVENVDELGSYAREQVGQPTWLSPRRPADSRIDPSRSLAEQFNLLRVVDNQSYPAFFEHVGHRYKLTIELWDPDWP